MSKARDKTDVATTERRARKLHSTLGFRWSRASYY